MKKLLVVAVAAAIATPAMADLTIGANAEYNLSNQDGMASSMESNLTISGSSTSETGVTLAVFTEIEATNTGSAGSDIDDLYLSIGNEAVTATVGYFGTKSAFNGGADMAAVGTGTAATGYTAKGLDDQGEQDIALTFAVAEGVTAQVSANFDDGDDSDYRVYVSADLGGFVVAANMQDAENDPAETGFALSVSATMADVALSASYAVNDNDAYSSAITAGFGAVSLAYVTNSDSAGNNAEAQYYGEYALGDFGIPGAAFKVGAGASNAAGVDSKVGFRANYTF